MSVKSYKGFDVPADMKLTKKAKKVLRKVRKNGKIGCWENDDSEYDTITQLIKIADDCGGRVVRFGLHDTTQLKTTSSFSSGSYAYIQD